MGIYYLTRPDLEESAGPSRVIQYNNAVGGDTNGGGWDKTDKNLIFINSP